MGGKRINCHLNKTKPRICLKVPPWKQDLIHRGPVEEWRNSMTPLIKHLRDSQPRKFHINLVWPLNQICLNAICRYRLLSFSLPLSNEAFEAQLWAPWPIKWIRLPVAFVLLAFALSSNIPPSCTTYIKYTHYYVWHAHTHLQSYLAQWPQPFWFLRGLCSNLLSESSIPPCGGSSSWNPLRYGLSQAQLRAPCRATLSKLKIMLPIKLLAGASW